MEAAGSGAFSFLHRSGGKRPAPVRPTASRLHPTGRRAIMRDMPVILIGVSAYEDHHPFPLYHP